MPKCGSQITICDLPVRFDTYKGCTHMCRYCFVQMKYNIAKVEAGEGLQSLQRFIDGKRTGEIGWCDWDIPIHWGGVSDPFQPVERIQRRSYAALKLFAETGYPFVISTKGALLGDDEYIDLLERCNCVVQVSLVSPQFDKLEKGAPTFADRLRIIKKVAPRVKRLIVRVQPYVVEVFGDILKQIPIYRQIGVYGITIEGMKYRRKRPGLERVAGDFCYPVSVLKQHFEVIRDTCHNNDLRFYAAENRLRKMGDSLCCCGVDGLEGFTPNSFNLSHYLYDRQTFIPTQRMTQPGSAECLKTSCQNSYSPSALRKLSLREVIEVATKDRGMISQLLEK